MRISDWSSDVCSSDLCGTPSPGLSARSMAAYSSPAYQASRRGRGPGLALAIAANVLLALLFLTMSSYSPLQRMAPTGLSVFNVSGSRTAEIGTAPCREGVGPDV